MRIKNTATTKPHINMMQNRPIAIPAPVSEELDSQLKSVSAKNGSATNKSELNVAVKDEKIIFAVYNIK